MSIEELQLVLQTITKIADTAGNVGIVWVMAHYLIQLVSVIAWPTAIIVLVMVIAGAVSDSFKSADRMREAVANAESLEATKRAELETKRAQLAVEKATIEAKSKDAVRQLCEIANAAGVQHSEHSGIYQPRDLASIKEKVAKK